MESTPVPAGQHARRQNASPVRGRRALLWAGVWFALSQLGLALWLGGPNAALRDLDRYVRLQTLRRRLAEAPAPPKMVLLLGSSHVQYGLRARRMSLHLSEVLGRPVVVSNQAIGGGSTLFALLHMDRLRRAGVRPDLVVIEVAPSLLRAPYADASERILPPERLDWDDFWLLRRRAARRADLGLWSRFPLLVPVYAHRAALGQAFVPFLLLAAPSPAMPYEEEVMPKLTAKQAERALRVAWNEYRDRLRLLQAEEPVQAGALDDLVHGLRAGGAEVILLACPEGPTFRSWYSAEDQKECGPWLRSLGRRYGVEVIDARHWTDREELFFDSHHMTEHGSAQFSDWFDREVLVRYLTGR